MNVLKDYQKFASFHKSLYYEKINYIQKRKKFFIKCWVFNSKRARLQFCALKWVWKLEPPYHILSNYYLKLSSPLNLMPYLCNVHGRRDTKNILNFWWNIFFSCFSRNKLEARADPKIWRIWKIWTCLLMPFHTKSKKQQKRLSQV